VALKHLQEPFDEPRVVNPHIPQSVENVILKSMRKNPAERYQSAAEMMRDLETCLLPERLHEPKITFKPRPVYDDDQETRVMPAIRSTTSDHAASPQGRMGNPPERSASSAATGADKRKAWVKPAIWA
ncbi:hypothetical protein KW823_25865, partial [Enterobacter quasiroggenkampii]|nr:hypothetical protein [Enterobacter quasiroggenkampii]